MAEVGLAFLSASLQVLFDRLASPDVVDFIMGKKLDPKSVQRLKRTLNAVGALVNDAENKQIEDVHVNNWLDDLKDAVYEADDLLDELSTKAATQSQKKVRNFPSFLNFQVRDNNLGNKIADIIERLEELAKHKDTLGLKHVVGERISWRPQSTSSLPSDMYGRGEDKKAIINLLLSDDMSHGKIGVIAIVGMGGIGKTTLAQLVYNDEKVRQKFDLFAWICVFEEFDVFNITKTVIENITSKPREKKDLDSLQLDLKETITSKPLAKKDLDSLQLDLKEDITSKPYEKRDLDSLQRDLKEKLEGKKFLFILDDVWNDSPTSWDPLMTSFYQGSEGSKLIVTTRSETVVRAASVIQRVQRVQRVHHLNFLSEEDCWLIFTKLAYPSEDPDLDSYLKKNRRDIMNKCKGLPLAAKLLGGLFQSKPDVKEWDIILKNNIWDLSKSKTLPALRISYHYLPPHLKRCFVHCSLFPKDYEFSKDELILLWMAEDLLQPMEGNMTLEEVGNEYFEYLLSRSFLQHSSNQSQCFVMHDLIHDLATFFAGKFYDTSKIGEEKNIIEETRHLSYLIFSDRDEYYRSIEIKFSEFKILSRTKALRTFLPLKWSYSGVSVENVQMLLKMLLNLKCMRALSVYKFEKLEILPKSICELIHLRYLDLSFTYIKKLPRSLCKLHNLQTLKLQSCYALTVLPNNIQDLVNLRFLDVSCTPLQKMPRGMGTLKNLHYLSDFIISKDQGARIEELGDLPNIGNRLSIKNIQYVSSGEEAALAKMLDKKHIESIEFIWTSDDHMHDATTERNILNKLQPHSHLKNLLITGYRGTEWPAWSGLQGVAEIILKNCKNCLSLPPLGQLPSLRRLEIERFDGLKSIGAEFYNSNESALETPFPSLECLRFSNMLAWQEWCLFEMGAFPQLKELSLRGCPKLVGYLPKHLPALKILRISDCQQLATCIPRARLFESIRISKSEGVVLQAEEGAISVKDLQIVFCKKLEFPNQVSRESLESLSIDRSCDSLCSFPIDAFPNLGGLTFWRCANLESIVVSQSVLQNVQSTTIEDNPNLASSSRGLPALNLTRLDVVYCPNFKSLPRHMDKLLPILKKLEIHGCPETEWHGEGNMPPHLTHLTIDQSVFAKFSKEWGLPSLTDLVIDGRDDNVQCFPAQGLLLPSSITTLWLAFFQTLETLDCNGFLHLASLKEITILVCPKLEKIAGERLPSSVERLEIIQCPLLEKQCRMKNAEIWPKISHIPAIKYAW